MKVKNKKFVILLGLSLFFLANVVSYAQASAKEIILELILEMDCKMNENRKIAYLTFDDGPSVYTEKLLAVLNEHEVPGIFFMLGNQLEIVENSDEILKRVVAEGHHIGLHTMTHDKNQLYWANDAPTTFTNEMLELRTKVYKSTGQLTSLCRAPYGKANHFKAGHYKQVVDAGFYCIDWHIDSQDWAKSNADQIYAEVVQGLESFENNHEIVILFHEYQRTVDILPDVINLLKSQGYTFAPYVEGKTFEGL